MCPGPGQGAVLMVTGSGDRRWGLAVPSSHSSWPWTLSVAWWGGHSCVPGCSRCLWIQTDSQHHSTAHETVCSVLNCAARNASLWGCCNNDLS